MKEAVWKAIKEPLRLLVLALIPFAVAYFADLPFEWAGAVTVLLRFVDKLLHELGKEQENPLLTRGLTQF